MFRRGRLTIQGTKDDRIKVINERLNLTEKHLLEICSAFLSLARRTAKHRDSFDELAKCLKSFADDEDINDSLKEGLNSFTNAVTLLGDYEDLSVHRCEIKLVNELAQFENICKNTRDNLRTSAIARDKEVLKQRQLEELKTKFSANNSAADSELLKAKLEVNRANKEIDEIICGFEKRKLGNLKAALSNFILISVKYHTKALEVLTASYYDVSNIDEKHDLHEFQKAMKYNDKELPKAAARKGNLKKSLKSSQSMESLDRDQLLSPLRREGRLSNSTKNLSKDTDDDVEENGEEEEDDEESEEETTEHNSSGEESSGSVSEDADNDVDEDDGKTPNSRTSASSKPFQVKASRQPFKAVAKAATGAAHDSDETSEYEGQQYKRRPGGIKSVSGSSGIAKGSASLFKDPRAKNPFEATTGLGSKPHRSAHNKANSGGGRLVTVVESKRKSSKQLANDTE